MGFAKNNTEIRNNLIAVDPTEKKKQKCTQRKRNSTNAQHAAAAKSETRTKKNVRR